MFQWLLNRFSSTASNQQLAFFLHIPKCAGTAIIRTISRAPQASWAIISESPESKLAANQTLVQQLKGKLPLANRLQVVMGHDVHFHMHQLPLFESRSAFYFTILREPIQRYLSHFRYLIQCSSNPDHPLYSFACHQVGSPGNKLTLDQYIEHKKMPNLMTQYLGAANHSDLNSKRWELDNQTLWKSAEAAIEQLDFIGFQDSLDRDLELLGHHLNLKLDNQKSNVTEGKSPQLSIDQKDKISKLCDLDIQLYELAKRKFRDRS